MILRQESGENLQTRKCLNNFKDRLKHGTLLEEQQRKKKSENIKINKLLKNLAYYITLNCFFSSSKGKIQLRFLEYFTSSMFVSQLEI